MIIISDTSCISALVRIGRLELLHEVFEQIVIPKKVHEELLKLNNFGVDTSIFAAQNWIHIFQPQPSPMLDKIITTTNFRLSAKIYNLILDLANEM